jgi:hypothetical protein
MPSDAGVLGQYFQAYWSLSVSFGLFLIIQAGNAVRRQNWYGSQSIPLWPWTSASIISGP